MFCFLFHHALSDDSQSLEKIVTRLSDNIKSSLQEPFSLKSLQNDESINSFKGKKNDLYLNDIKIIQGPSITASIIRNFQKFESIDPDSFQMRNQNQKCLKINAIQAKFFFKAENTIFAEHLRFPKFGNERCWPSNLNITLMDHQKEVFGKYIDLLHANESPILIDFNDPFDEIIIYAKSNDQMFLCLPIFTLE